jgi:hypothetical protein
MRRSGIDVAAGPIYLGYRLRHRSERPVFRSLVYNSPRSSCMLRRLVGDDAFFFGLRRFCRVAIQESGDRRFPRRDGGGNRP